MHSKIFEIQKNLSLIHKAFSQSILRKTENADNCLIFSPYSVHLMKVEARTTAAKIPCD